MSIKFFDMERLKQIMDILGQNKILKELDMVGLEDSGKK
jgi:hypothetical protein